jgi:hypothetical protein
MRGEVSASRWSRKTFGCEFLVRQVIVTTTSLEHKEEIEVNDFSQVLQMSRCQEDMCGTAGSERPGMYRMGEPKYFNSNR